MITGFMRIELTEKYRGNELIIPGQKIMIKMLSKILSNDEIKKITGFKKTEIAETITEQLNEKENTLYNLSWDLYVRMMHDQVKQKTRDITHREFWNPFSSLIISGIY